MALATIIFGVFMALSGRSLIVNASAGGKILGGLGGSKYQSPNTPCIQDNFAPISSGTGNVPKLDELHGNGNGKKLLCLASNGKSNSGPQFAVAYDLDHKIPVMAFKSYPGCTPSAGSNRCKLYKSSFDTPNFNNNDMAGTGSVTTKTDIQGNKLTFYLSPTGEIDGYDSMDRGHLLSRELGAGLETTMASKTNPNEGMEATFNMANIIPQFRNSNEHGVWRRLEKSAAGIVEMCVGHFYLVTSVEDYQQRKYSCGETYSITFRGKSKVLPGCVVEEVQGTAGTTGTTGGRRTTRPRTTRPRTTRPRTTRPRTTRPRTTRTRTTGTGTTGRRTSRQVRGQGTKRPSPSSSDERLAFPQNMYIAGCCRTGADVKLYYGAAKNDHKEDTTTLGTMLQYGTDTTYSFAAFNQVTNDLFKDTVCYRT